MERLIINIPEKKSVLVKQILKGLGVTFGSESPLKPSAYKKKLSKVSVWSGDDIKNIEETTNAFEDLKPQQW